MCCMAGYVVIKQTYKNIFQWKSFILATLLGPHCASPRYTWDLNYVITVPPDVLAPGGARPSAGTDLAEKLDMLSIKFHWLPIIL